MNYTNYSSSEVEKLLRDLVPSQDSIEQASSAFLQMGEKGFVKKLVQDWIGSFRYYSDLQHHVKRVALLYLANDIIQKCKGRAAGFSEEFKGALVAGFKIIAQLNDENNLPAALKLVELWRDRKIYGKDAVTQMHQVLTDKSLRSKKKDEMEVEGVSIPEGLIAVPAEVVAFADATKDLEKWKQKTLAAEKSLKEFLQDGDFNDDEAQVLLSDYKKCIELEQKYRTNLMKSEMELWRHSDTDHMKYTHLLKKVIGLQEDIEGSMR